MIDRFLQNLKEKPGYGTEQGIVLSGKDIQLLVDRIISNNYLVSSKTFTFTQANACNVTPLTTTTPSSPSKTMLPIAFYYTQALSGGDSFGVDFYITMTNGGTLSKAITAFAGDNLTTIIPLEEPTAIDSSAIEPGESFQLTSNGGGAGTAGTVTITTLYIEI